MGTNNSSQRVSGPQQPRASKGPIVAFDVREVEPSDLDRLLELYPGVAPVLMTIVKDRQLEEARAEIRELKKNGKT